MVNGRLKKWIIHLHKRQETCNDAVELDEAPEPPQGLPRNGDVKDVSQGLVLNWWGQKDLDVVNQFPEAVDEDTLGQDHGLDDQLRRRLKESLNEPQVGWLLVPVAFVGLTVSTYDPGKKYLLLL